MQDVMLSVAFWEGHVVQSCRDQADGSLLIELDEDPTREAQCGACGEPCALVHERSWRRVRERDWFDRRVWLRVPCGGWTVITAEPGRPSELAG